MAIETQSRFRFFPVARNIAAISTVVALTLILPPLIYGLLVWLRFDFVSLSSYVPHEELRQAAQDPFALLAAPLWSVNMTSGFLLSNMYSLTVGQFLLAVGMGLAIGLNFVAYLGMRRLCAAGGGPGAAAATATGLIATLGASSTGIIGCCGSGLAGGILTLAGVGAGSAAAVAEWSVPLQMLIMAGFVFNWAALRRRAARAAAS